MLRALALRFVLQRLTDHRRGFGRGRLQVADHQAVAFVHHIRFHWGCRFRARPVPHESQGGDQSQHQGQCHEQQPPVSTSHARRSCSDGYLPACSSSRRQSRFAFRVSSGLPVPLMRSGRGQRLPAVQFRPEAPAADRCRWFDRRRLQRNSRSFARAFRPAFDGIGSRDLRIEPQADAAQRDN